MNNSDTLTTKTSVGNATTKTTLSETRAPGTNGGGAYGGGIAKLNFKYIDKLNRPIYHIDHHDLINACLFYFFLIRDFIKCMI